MGGIMAREIEIYQDSNAELQIEVYQDSNAELQIEIYEEE
jgi:hypothetical protein